MEKIGLCLLNIKSTSNKFIYEYEKFQNLSVKFWSNSLYIDLLDPFETQIIDFIFVGNRTKLDKNDLNVLMSPDKISNFQKSRLELLKICKVAEKEGLNSKKVKSLLQKHSYKYYWQKNDYEKVKYLDCDYYLEELKKLLKNNKETKNIKRDLSGFKKNQRFKKQLIKKYKLSKKNVNFLNFFNWITEYRDDRKKFNQIGNYILVKIIEKISKELKIDIEILKYALPNEIISIVKGNENILKELLNRSKNGLVVFTDKRGFIDIVSNIFTKKYFSILERGISASEISGNTASPGKVIGIVKIILNQNDFKKMQKCDVLVASMTRPEYVSIMKLASAIVTDEGGVTSHAAIASRELGVPCITGTQVSTKVLKDGDLVEVDANQGIVRILKKHK